MRMRLNFRHKILENRLTIHLRASLLFKFKVFHSLRAKLILASVLVEIVMLGLLVSNGVRLIDQGLLDQAKLKNEDLKP